MKSPMPVYMSKKSPVVGVSLCVCRYAILKSPIVDVMQFVYLPIDTVLKSSLDDVSYVYLPMSNIKKSSCRR